MAARALITIGVSSAPPLEYLPGASQDAHRMAEWGDKNSYDVYEFSDARGNPVLFQPIYDCCERLLADDALENLIIYFAGHGYSPMIGHEVWLLSKWRTRSNEAIHATLSLAYAQRMHRPRVSFVADACRSTWTTGVPPNGSVIFPPPPDMPVPSEVDEFFATPFGAIAQEVSGSRDSFGIFSREVRRALNGKAAIARKSRRVVSSASLKRYLDRTVPKALKKISGAQLQFPATNAQWREPNDVYADFGLPDAPHFRPTPGGEKAPRERVVRGAGFPQTSPQQMRIAEVADRYTRAEVPISTHLRTGVAVIGAAVGAVALSEGKPEILESGDVFQLQIAAHSPITALLVIREGKWAACTAPVVIYPGLVATVLIDDDGFSSLSYRPSYATAKSSQTERVVAEAAAMLRFGLVPERQRIRDMVAMLRHEKDVNPALAIIAAHLCHRIGDIETIRDMENYAIGLGSYTPYDVFLLSDREQMADERKLAGDFPLLARAWAVLDGTRSPLRDIGRQVVRGVAPSLWTLARPSAARILARLIAAKFKSLSPELRVERQFEVEVEVEAEAKAEPEAEY